MNDSFMCVYVYTSLRMVVRSKVCLYTSHVRLFDIRVHFLASLSKAFVVVSEEASIQTCWNKDNLDDDDDGQQAGPAGGPISCSHAEREEYRRM